MLYSSAFHCFHYSQSDPELTFFAAQTLPSANPLWLLHLLRMLTLLLFTDTNSRRTRCKSHEEGLQALPRRLSPRGEPSPSSHRPSLTPLLPRRLNPPPTPPTTTALNMVYTTSTAVSSLSP